MFKNLRIKTKILFSFTAITIIAVSISGYIAYTNARVSLKTESFNKLTAIREMKTNQIEDYFQQITDQIITLSEDRMIIDAMKAFDSGLHTIEDELSITKVELNGYDNETWRYYQDDYLVRLIPNLIREVPVSKYWSTDVKTRILQYMYITSNIYDTGSKYLLDNADDGSSYSQAHEIYHPIIRDYIERFGFYDIFLVDVGTGAHIAYSVFKELDYGTSLLTGPYSQSNIATAYLRARDATDKDFVTLVDYQPYEPSYNAPAAFIASPIYSDDEKIGVLIFQMPIDRINDIITNKHAWTDVGLGQSGETYLVGDDFTLRNQSRFLIEDSNNYFKMIEETGVPLAVIDRIRNLNSTIGLQEVKTQGTEAALRGEKGTAIFPDYRGIPVLSSYKPLTIPDLSWVIMSEIDESEAFSYIYDLRNKIIGSAAGLIAIIIFIASLFAKTITKPVQILTKNAVELAQGNLDIKIDINGQDEIGKLAQSFDVMRGSIKNLIEELKVINRDLEDKVIERTAELKRASERFRSIVKNASDAIITVNSDQRVVLFNPAAEKIFGYTTKEVLGKPLAMLLPEFSLGIYEPKVEKFKDAPINSHSTAQTIEITGKRKNSERFPGEIGISSMKLNQEIFYTAFLHDITVRKRMEVQLQEHLQTIKIQRDRMQVELNFAREIQMSMLPLIFPAFPNRKEFSVFAILHPAREVGGDFYDFFFIDKDHFCFVIGDVSGKGAPGALLMAVSKTLIKSRAMDDNIPASILTHVNNELSQNNISSMFVTVFLCIMDVRTGEILYSNAGHNPPYIKRNNGSIEKLDAFHGPVIGAMPGLTYKQDTARIGKNDIIFLYTDGVTEAMDESEQLFSEERLANLLRKDHLKTEKNLVDATVSEVQLFQDKAEQADDITILAVQYKGGQSAFNGLRITIKNRLADLDIVENQFHEFAKKNDLSENIRQKVSLVLDDLLNNIVSYAYKDDDKHEITIDIELSEKRLALTIKDDGIPFNPFSLKSPDISASLDERSVGGLGIHIIRSVMDEYLYQRLINKNVITLVKMLEDKQKNS